MKAIYSSRTEKFCPFKLSLIKYLPFEKRKTLPCLKNSSRIIVPASKDIT